MSIDHRRFHARVAEKLLNAANIGSVFEKMGCKGMSQRVAIDGLAKSRPVCGRLYGFLQRLGHKMMPPDHWLAIFAHGARIFGKPFARKDPLPAQHSAYTLDWLATGLQPDKRR